MSSPQPVLAAPAEIQQVASTYHLGTIRQVYGPNTGLVRGNKTGAGCMLLVGLALSILGIASLAGGAAGGVWILLGIVCGGGGCLFFLLRAAHMAHKNVRLYLCDQGFISQNDTSAAEPFRWDQIAAVWRTVKIVHNYASRQINATPIVRITYTIERRDGRTFLLDHTLSGFDSLSSVISTRVKEQLLPQALQACAQGQTLTFGPLALKQQGVINGQQLLPWNQIEAIDTQIDYSQEVIRVKQRGARRDWAKVTTSTIPNLAVFRALVDYTLKQQPGLALQGPPGMPSSPAKAFPESPAPQAYPAASALDVLQQRFARGEIDAATYQHMRDMLSR